VRYNLSLSGVTPLPADQLGLSLADITTVEPHADGWAPVMECIAARQALDAKCVVTTHACAMANHLAFAALVEPGDHVVLESPVYEPLTRLVEYFGARAIPFPRREANGWHLDPDQLDRVLTPRTTLVVLSNLHNPSGAFDDDATLLQIAEHAARVGAHVLVDEVYLEVLYADGVRTAARIAPNVLTTGSMTKVWGLPALRFGWVLAEPVLAERIRRVNDLFSTSTAHPSARIALRALEQSDQRVAASNALLARNIQAVDRFVQTHARLSWVRPRAGTCGLVRVEGIDTDVLADRLSREYQVAVVPGSFFDAPDHIRLSWTLDTPDLEAALVRVGDAVNVLP
jgi:aspartate/methionine/tyrosine aminotransferase